MKSYVSNNEINELCEALIFDYTKSRKCTSVDIEGFITNYLNLDIVYVVFADEDMSKEGYLSDGKSPLLIYENGKARKVVFPKYTIVLDRYLLKKEQSGRHRFTLAHEAGHYIMSKHNPEQTIPSYRRSFDGERDYSAEEMTAMFSIGEFLADKVAAGLLMPRFIIDSVVGKYYKGKHIKVYGDNIFAPEDKVKLRQMADEIGVSFSALIIRLKNFDYLRYYPVNIYLQKYLMAGDEL